MADLLLLQPVILTWARRGVRDGVPGIDNDGCVRDRRPSSVVGHTREDRRALKVVVCRRTWPGKDYVAAGELRLQTRRYGRLDRNQP